MYARKFDGKMTKTDVLVIVIAFASTENMFALYYFVVFDVGGQKAQEISNECYQLARVIHRERKHNQN